jgi:hypothetical protein
MFLGCPPGLLTKINGYLPNGSRECSRPQCAPTEKDGRADIAGCSGIKSLLGCHYTKIDKTSGPDPHGNAINAIF